MNASCTSLLHPRIPGWGLLEAWAGLRANTAQHHTTPDRAGIVWQYTWVCNPFTVGKPRSIQKLIARTQAVVGGCTSLVYIIQSNTAWHKSPLPSLRPSTPIFWVCVYWLQSKRLLLLLLLRSTSKTALQGSSPGTHPPHSSTYLAAAAGQTVAPPPGAASCRPACPPAGPSRFARRPGPWPPAHTVQGGGRIRVRVRVASPGWGAK